MPDLWNEDWPDDLSRRERRAAFIESMRPWFPKAADPFADEELKRIRASLASANRYHEERDPRTIAQRLGYARWTLGEDGVPE